MSVTISATITSITATATVGCTQTITTTNVTIEHYITTASTTQTFTEFIGFSLSNMYVNLQGAGNMGHLAGLATARKLITAWDSATGVATFANALQAGWQITVIGTN